MESLYSLLMMLSFISFIHIQHILRIFTVEKLHGNFLTRGMVKHRWGALWLFLLWLTQPQLFAGPGRVTHPEPIGKWLQVLESPQGARCFVFFQLSDMKPSKFSRCFFFVRRFELAILRFFPTSSRIFMDFLHQS